MPHARAWALRPRRRGALAALVVIALLPVLVLAGTPQPAWADGEPTVTVGNDLLTAGDQVQVSGTGWQDGELLQVNICAQPDRTGAMQCAEGGVSNVQVMWDGSFSTSLTVALPEGDCPCSIMADSQQAPPVLVPVTLEGSRNAKPGKVPDVVVESAELVGVGSVGSWFGASARPTLELTLRNDGTAPASPELDLVWRDGDGDPRGLSAPAVPKIEPGQVARLEVPVRFDGLAHGEHTVRGTVRVGDLETAVEASTSIVPWGLYGLGLLVLLGATALRTRWVMSELHEDDDPDRDEEPAPAPDVAPLPDVETQALETITRYTAVRAAPEPPPAPETPAEQPSSPKVPSQRTPGGGRRAASKEKSRAGSRRASGGPWLTRR